MFVEEIAPALVPEGGSFPCVDSDDVGEEHSGEDAVDRDRSP